MKVAHVAWDGGVGGIERLVHDVALTQHRAGEDVTVVFGRAEGPFADRLRRAGVPLVDLGLRSHRHASPRALATVRASFAAVDVVHLHTLSPAIVLPVTLVRRPPLVFTEHLPLASAGVTYRVCESAFLRLRAAAVVPVSDYVGGLVTSRLRIRPSPTIANGVLLDGEIAAEREACVLPGDDGRPTVAFVGRLSDSKRADRLLDAAARCDGHPVRILVVGDGPARRDLEEQTDRLGLRDAVEFLGTRQDVRELLETVDVLVQPSVGEAFGLVVLEAALAGACPVVFADGGGSTEIVPPTGRVVRDVDELAHLLQHLGGSDALTLDARRERAAWVRANFSIERTVEGYAQLYAALARRPTRRSWRSRRSPARPILPS